MITTCMTAMILIAAVQDAPAAQDQAATSQPATPREIMSNLSIREILADAERLLEEGNISFAINAYKHILSRDLANIDAVLGLAGVAEMQRDFNAARGFYLKARVIDKTDFRANYGLGSSYLSIGYSQQALRYLEFAERFVPADKTSEFNVRLAIAYRGTGARSKAKRYAQMAVDADPDDYTAQEVLAVAQVEDGEYDQARGHIDAMVRIARDRLADDPANPRNIQFLLGALDRELEVLNMYHLTMYEKDPTGKPTDRLNPGQDAAAAASLLPLIDTELQKGELQKILRMHGVLPLAQRAVELDPTNTEILMRLGLLYVNTSQVDSAIESFQKIIALDPNHVRAVEHLTLLGAPLQPPAAPSDPAAAPPGER